MPNPEQTVQVSHGGILTPVHIFYADREKEVGSAGEI